MKTTNGLAVFVAATLFFTGCQKDSVPSASQQPTQDSKYFVPSQAYLSSFDKLVSDHLANPTALGERSSCQWTEIPAGSTDALAQAVNNACAGGVIYFKAGSHTESQTVTITKSVILIGEAGAVLSINSTIQPVDPATGKFSLVPALHILNAPNTAIVGLDIRTVSGSGATAILFENSSQGAVMSTKITNFGFSIWIARSNQMTIMNNTIVAASDWQTNPNVQVMGIANQNGSSSYIAGNDISNGLWGIFLSDKYGTVTQNNTHGNVFGIFLCRLKGDYLLPSKQVAAADFPATLWKINNNQSSGNGYSGYLIIDAANQNILANNQASNNAGYDIELVGDTNRYGFFTASSFSNTVSAAQGQKVKDCGNNNTVSGVTLVNTALDPCK